MGRDDETCAAQHCLGTTSVRNPPIGRIVGVAMLDKMQLGEIIAFELVGCPEVVVLLDFPRAIAATQHGLKQQNVARDVLVDQIECQQRVPQVIENAHENDKIKSLAELTYVVDGHVAELDIKVAYFSCEASLREIFFPAVEAEY